MNLLARHKRSYKRHHSCSSRDLRLDQVRTVGTVGTGEAWASVRPIEGCHHRPETLPRGSRSSHERWWPWARGASDVLMSPLPPGPCRVHVSFETHIPQDIPCQRPASRLCPPLCREPIVNRIPRLFSRLSPITGSLPCLLRFRTDSSFIGLCQISRIPYCQSQ